VRTKKGREKPDDGGEFELVVDWDVREEDGGDALDAADHQQHDYSSELMHAIAQTKACHA
jgi:hypothetical protein